MKKALVLAIGMLLVSGAAFAAITGSAHDFRGDAWYTPNTTICTPCHAPHNNLNAAGDLLWNHAASSATYTMYENTATIDGVIDTTPANISKVCLSCHDGTVALDSYGGATGSTTISGNANMGTILSEDHPISITYVPGAAGIEMNATNSAYADGDIADYLFANKVECASCHDVHNGGNAATVNDTLLVESQAASAICLACHIK